MSVDHLGAAPPHDLPAERAILGAMLLSADAATRSIELLRAGDFYEPRHGELFSLMTTMFLAGTAIDAVTVATALRERGLLSRYGNGAYLSDLLSAPGALTTVDHYARAIQDTAVMRRLAVATLHGHAIATNPHTDTATAAAQIADEVLAAATEHIPDTAVSAGQAVADALEHADAIAAGHVSLRGIPTGYPDLDALTLGIHPGQLILIAGRPAIGKSVAMLDIVRHIAVHQRQPVLFCSLEMSVREIGQRLAAAETGVPLQHLRDGTLTDAERSQIADAATRIADAPLHIDDNTSVTVADIRAKATRHARRHGLAAIAIDYLGLITHPNARAENRQVQVAEISRGLKILAKDIAPVLVAAQLNRGPEARADKRPMLSDLRESGSLEQDGDVVVLLHREDAYHPETDRAGEIDLIVAKQRNGPTGTVSLAHQFAKSRLVPMWHD